MRVIAGDIGGTKTLLELSERDGEKSRIIARQRYPSSAYGDFGQIVEAFLARYDDPHHPTCHHACFGVAGPIERRGTETRSTITNLPWIIDSAELTQRFGFKKVRLINDFTAVAYGVGLLDEEALVQLQTGERESRATRLVIGAGTGLGVAQIVCCGERDQVLATEGGHVDFAPRKAIEIALLRYLSGQQGRVACEDVVSGPGLVNIYRFLHQHRGGESSRLETMLASEDIAAAIALAAERSEDPLATEAIALFVTLYGAIAGNFALSSMAQGGVYIAGGIAPKMLTQLQEGGFMAAFNDKGKMSSLNSRVPVAVVVEPEVGLIGSRHIANCL